MVRAVSASLASSPSSSSPLSLSYFFLSFSSFPRFPPPSASSDQKKSCPTRVGSMQCARSEVEHGEAAFSGGVRYHGCPWPCSGVGCVGKLPRKHDERTDRSLGFLKRNRGASLVVLASPCCCLPRSLRLRCSQGSSPNWPHVPH